MTNLHKLSTRILRAHKLTPHTQTPHREDSAHTRHYFHTFGTIPQRLPQHVRRWTKVVAIHHPTQTALSKFRRCCVIVIIVFPTGGNAKPKYNDVESMKCCVNGIAPGITATLNLLRFQRESGNVVCFFHRPTISSDCARNAPAKSPYDTARESARSCTDS